VTAVLDQLAQSGQIAPAALAQVPLWFDLVAVAVGAVQGASFALLDAVVLGVFVVVGVVKASNAGLGPASAILLGTITGVGGGVLRDLLARRPINVMQRTAPYGMIAVGAAAVFVALTAIGVDSNLSALITFVAAVAVRMVALLRGWQTPRPPTIPPQGPWVG